MFSYQHVWRCGATKAGRICLAGNVVRMPENNPVEPLQKPDHKVFLGKQHRINSNDDFKDELLPLPLWRT